MVSHANHMLSQGINHVFVLCIQKWESSSSLTSELQHSLSNDTPIWLSQSANTELRAQSRKHLSSERLGEDVCHHVLSCAVLLLDDLGLHTLADEVVPNVDVLGA